ncbi:hypothetical protein CKJ90_05675 [Klebsiella pneumoniae]|nr:hypothetical protein CKJ90_05675 [Klebsiella pneumoniae]
MRIGPASVNLFFKENRCNVTVWLGCEQLAGIFGNYWLFIVFQRYKSGKKKTDPGGRFAFHRPSGLICRPTGGHRPRGLMDRSWF